MVERVSNFRDLKVWQLGKEIVLDVYKLTSKFPKEEMYCLTSQMRRCAVSIPSNVAEGYNRNAQKEFARFLNISLGSSAELETQVEISMDLGYLTQEAKTKLLEKLDHESKMLNKFISNL